jgi:predicted hotdog family 3-hydroxylacyl-ACP dehydratase
MNVALTLPIAAEHLIPHRSPMLLVERLVSCDAAGSGTVEACLGKDSLLTGPGGTIDEIALVEIIAQSYAAIKGYCDLLQERPVQKGFLVGMRKLQVSGSAGAGDRLSVRIKLVGSFEGFAVVEGQVLCRGEAIASGTIKLWLVDEEPEC